jgi:hypothetical protein
LAPAWTFSENSAYWKEPNSPVRFRYSIDNETFFFSRENVYYQKRDIKRIIVGEAHGNDTRGDDGLGIHHDQKPRAQCFILLLGRDEQWHRHDISMDLSYLFDTKGSQPFIKLAELLKPLTDCEVVIRRYSKKECYRQQRSDNPNAAVPNSEKILW